MKYIVIVPDGAADYPLEELGGLTPLQAARTPNMDWLACHGLTGSVKKIFLRDFLLEVMWQT